MAGIYVHIPFCKKLCHYCDFYHIISKDDNKDFIASLLAEADLRRDYIGSETISTIYFGGGTPSVLQVRELGILMDYFRANYTIDPDCEVTIEVNPDDVTPACLKELKSASFNRISLGIQSFRDEDLSMLNRRHTAAQAVEAINSVLNAGFKNTSVDLIYGLPQMDTTAWEKNLLKAFSFEIMHLSAYHLTIEPGTLFGKMKDKGLLKEIDEEESVAQFSLLVDLTGSAGFVHYEISNFGKPGFFSRHNTSYWKQVPYIGLGPSAHSFNGYSRQWNIRDVKKYNTYVRSGKDFYEKEELDIKTRFNEYIMTSLRTMWGIDLEYVEKAFEKEGYDYVNNLSGKFIRYGLMKLEKNALVLTNQGKMISDNIISEFMMPGRD